jgi:hypothetical protein
MSVKKSLLLNQIANLRFDRTKKESDTNAKVSYVVTKAINTTDGN